MTKISLDIKSTNLTDEQFFKLCRANETWQLEITAKQELVIASGLGGIWGNYQAEIIGLLGAWNRQTNLGIVFSSSTILDCRIMQRDRPMRLG